MNEAKYAFSAPNDYSRGTAVASIIGSLEFNTVWPANIQDVHFHGVARGANLRAYAMTLGSGGGTYTANS
ncbi:MAG: hypothetical protein OXI60_09185 [Acidiferrobacterales bacterium]|nr:hypothetical protein [Acidiferrobacterales bacterium]